ncbi:MAG: efflux RND transporter permease subunit, partial [Bacteroidota bacterium]
IAKQEYESFAINFSLSGSIDLLELKQIALKVEKELQEVEGISKINLSGFPREEIEISFREADLRRYELTFDQALARVQSSNIEVTGGKMKTQQEELLIRVRNKEYLAEDLRNIVIQNNSNGGLLYLHQVADIKDQWEDVPSRSYLNGEAAIIFTINNTIREDVLDITEYVRNYVEEFNRKHQQVKITVIEDGSEVLNDRINLLRDNGIIGFFLVILILALFLNWRLAFWVGLAIPTSFAGMLIFVGYLGVTINLMSLFGMIIVIGILVDDGIVIAENIFQKYESGLPPMEAALEGTMEVLPAVFSAIITTVVAFCGFFFVEGSLGEFGIELAIVVIISLVFSLIEGALILPAHVAHSKALKERNPKVPFFLKALNQLMNFLRDYTYQPVLRFSIEHAFPMIAICILCLLVTIGAYQGGQIRNTFFPNMPSERFYVNLKMPAGTRAELTEKVLRRIETEAEEMNREFRREYFNDEEDLFINLVRNLGPTSHEGIITVSLIPTEKRGNFTARDLSAILRDRVGPVYEAEFLQYRAPGAFGKPVDISVLGDDYQDLEQAITEIQSSLSQMEELRDVIPNNSEGLKEISIDLKDKAYYLGFTPGEVIRQVRQGYFGGEVQDLQRGSDEVKVWVRYDANDRADLGQLGNMYIRNAGGLSVPLAELADFSIERGIMSLQHLDGKREVRIEAEIANSRVSVSGVLAKIERSVIPPVLEKYPTVKVIYNGQSREQAKTMSSMTKTVGLILLVIFFIILLTFQSLSQTLIIFVVIPFGFVGVGLGHYVMDLPVSMVSFLGFVALIGVLVNDALVFVTMFNDKIKAGLSFETALHETGLSRFRPIVLTSVTTIVGLGPILLERSLGAQLIIPMAVSLAFGLLIVTVIILAMIPSLLVISKTIRVQAMMIWEGKEIEATALEPAHQHRPYNYWVVAFGAALTLVAFLGMIYLAWYLVGLW